MIDSGCFRHVCPPWFAPQFPMVSSFNFEAVAAATLRTESGLTTNSGRRILIQITFDVMSVRKPLPEHFCTETSWRHNHLQSRL